jgi:hypothetical protein
MTTAALATTTATQPRRPLTPHERAVLRAMTCCADDTIRAWWDGAGKDGRRVRQASAIRLADAARKIGLLPPEEG